MSANEINGLFVEEMAGGWHEWLEDLSNPRVVLREGDKVHRWWSNRGEG